MCLPFTPKELLLIIIFIYWLGISWRQWHTSAAALLGTILGHREWADSHTCCWHFHQFAPQPFGKGCACCGAHREPERCTPREDSRQAWYTAVPFLSCLLRRSPREVPDLRGKLNTATLFRPTGLGFCSEHSCKGQAAACNLPRTPAEAEVLCPERPST